MFQAGNLSDNLGVSRAPIWGLLVRFSVALLVVMSIGLGISRFSGIYVDDAYIQLQYARNLVDHHTWGFYPQHPANTATSPLNVIVTALMGSITSTMVDAVVWLTTAEMALMCLLLLLISQRLFNHYYFGAFAFIALATNPLLLSTMGLEGFLYTFLVIASLYLFLVCQWFALVVALGLLTLTRHDGLLLFMIVLMFLPLPLKDRGKFALSYLLILTPWHLYSWIHLGSAIPDTLIIKRTQQAWESTTFATGLLWYLDIYPVFTVTSFFLFPLGLWGLKRCNRDIKRIAAILGIYGAAHYLVYSLMRVPPYHWYYLHQMIPAVVLGSLGISNYLSSAVLAKKPLARPVAAIALTLPTIGIVYFVATSGFRFNEPPIHTNLATPDHYKGIGLWLQQNLDPSASVDLHGEIGTLAFYSDRYLLNEFSSMTYTTKLIAQSRLQHVPVVGTMYRVNFMWRFAQEPLPPPSYMLQQVIFEDGQGGGPPGDGWLRRLGVLDRALRRGLQRVPRPQEGTSVERDIVMSWDTSTRWEPMGRVYLRKVENR